MFRRSSIAERCVCASCDLVVDKRRRGDETRRTGAGTVLVCDGEIELAQVLGWFVVVCMLFSSRLLLKLGRAGKGRDEQREGRMSQQPPHGFVAWRAPP